MVRLRLGLPVCDPLRKLTVGRARFQWFPGCACPKPVSEVASGAKNHRVSITIPLRASTTRRNSAGLLPAHAATPASSRRIPMCAIDGHSSTACEAARWISTIKPSALNQFAASPHPISAFEPSFFARQTVSPQDSRTIPEHCTFCGKKVIDRFLARLTDLRGNRPRRPGPPRHTFTQRSRLPILSLRCIIA